MKEKDAKLIQALKPNPRQSISELARALGVSRTAAQQRLSRLEADGTIAGYAVVLGDRERESQLRAHINLTISPNEGKKISAALENITAIETLYTVSGKFDMIALISANTAAELDRYLDQISAVPGVLSTETAIILTTKFSRF